MAERASERNPAQQAFNRLHHFHGGLKLAGHRELTMSEPITPAGIPPLLVLPLLQHIGEPAEALVKPGDRVHTGELIARAVGTVSAPVHASSSGTVVAIEPRPVPHPSALPADCIVIETDGRDQWLDPPAGQPDYRAEEPLALLERIRAAGIVGLGGAGFPTRVKLTSGKRAIDTLIINGAECEPYITCDERLMRERATEVIEGVRILQHIVQPRDCTIAIEDSMPAAETALRDALVDLEDLQQSEAEIPRQLRPLLRRQAGVSARRRGRQQHSPHAPHQPPPPGAPGIAPPRRSGRRGQTTAVAASGRTTNRLAGPNAEARRKAVPSSVLVAAYDSRYPLLTARSETGPSIA